MRIAAAALVALALVVPMRAEIIEQVLVKVNGDIITKTDLEARQIAALRDRGPIDPEALKNDEELKKALREITPQLLVNAVDELLLVQLGREKGYRLSDDQFKSWLENLRKEQNLQDDARFQAALKQEGMTVDDLRRQVERSFLIQRVQQDEVGSKLSITEEEARQYYRAHRDEFVEPASVTLREIFIEIPTATQAGQAGVNVAQDDAAKEKAEAAYQRVTGGEDFGKVAAEISDSASKANGGLIGPLPVADLSDALRKSLETMKPGEVMKPVRAGKGYQILKLEAMTPATVQPFESVRDVVADRVYEVRQQAEVRKFLSRIRSQAIIEWKNDDLRKMYEARVAASAKGD
ncbi:MAG TPA: peptidyl-prolyl cis-trans isomerase [Vicinamibacterales bacterium]|nr:peptidyl-prolyl cis-trans isomerase [Vicinamibacterales bacterium]